MKSLDGATTLAWRLESLTSSKFSTKGTIEKIAVSLTGDDIAVARWSQANFLSMIRCVSEIARQFEKIIKHP